MKNTKILSIVLCMLILLVTIPSPQATEENENNNDSKPNVFNFGFVFGKTFLLRNWCVYPCPHCPIQVDGITKTRSGRYFCFYLLRLPLNQEYTLTADTPDLYSNIETVTLTSEKRFARINFNLKDR